jgi:hypothetical protein
MKEITLPTIHSNGTSKETLLKGWNSVNRAFNQLNDSINQVEFNARDYYVREGAWEQAQKEFFEAMGHLQSFNQYMHSMQYGIAAGGHKNED